MLLLMESKNCAMATNTGSSALKEEEIELELGLSIGGSYTRQNGNKLESDTHIDVGSGEKNPDCIRSSISPNAFIVDAGQEKDQKTKREIHALRRQEAKKKREEKQLKRGSCKGNFNGAQLNGENVYNNNGMLLKVKHFQAKEREVDMDKRECKKSKKEKSGSDHNHNRNVNLNLTFHQNDDVTNNIGTCFPIPSTSSPVHYPHLPVQYGMPANGFVYPCANVNVMPCCFTGGTTADTEGRNVVQVQPVVSYGFVPFQAVMNPDHNMGDGYDSEQNCSRNGGNKKAGSNGSTKCTSSTGSDNRSSSHEGGGSSSISSYSRSNSSSSMFKQPLLNGSRANDARGQSEHTALFHLTESASGNEATNNVEKLIPSNSSQSSPTGNKDEAKSEIESDPTDNRISTPENPASTPHIESKGEVGKPPKPVSQNHSTPPLPCMPCVSTTGNGPNGKTINGFLYRYTKTEVSIICVCHGSSFSPAEFVQHAGGTDVSHPLRHITVIPSAF